MAQCVKVSQNQDGSLRFEPDSQPDLQQCAFVLQTGGELGNSLTSLTPAQGAEISGYVAALWASAWVIKQLAKLLNIGDSNATE